MDNISAFALQSINTKKSKEKINNKINILNFFNYGMIIAIVYRVYFVKLLGIL